MSEPPGENMHTVSGPSSPAARVAAEPLADAKHSLLPRPLVRLVIGLAASVCGFPALWILMVGLGVEGAGAQDCLAKILLFPLVLLAGVFAGWAAFADSIPVRIAAWGIAGFGAGFLLDGMLGCLGASDVVGPSGLVLGVVFMFIGYREQPQKQANSDQP